MDAMTTERPTIGHNVGRMTEAEYERERAKIAATKQQAGMRWEQELAALFYRSGWTVAQLAKREELSGNQISCLLRFGRFLDYQCQDANPETLAKLSEKRFRTIWWRAGEGKDDRKGLYERERFRKIARIISEESEEWLAPGQQRGRRLPPDTSFKIINKCGDGKWRSANQIASRVGLEPDQAQHLVTHSLTSSHRDKCAVETKKVGKETHFRIFKKDKTVSTNELTEKLTPILQELEAEGKKNMATMVPAKVAMLTARIKQLLKEWAE
jgi:hypothetical protein